MKLLFTITVMLLISSITSLGQNVTGSGTVNYITKFTTASTVGNSSIYNNGTNVGIGNAAPATPLEVAVPTGNTGNIIRASGFSVIYDANRANGVSAIPSQIGLGWQASDLGGLTYFNDGSSLVNIGVTASQKLISTFGTNSANDAKFLRVLSPGSNQFNYSIELSTRAPTVQPVVWYGRTGASLTAYNQPLNIGSFSPNSPVRIYANNEKITYQVADIFIQNSHVGIGTETPDANAELDVNGNLYCRNTLYIGTPNASTTSQVSGYALAVNGTAIFNKAKVKSYGTWPDYVFDEIYNLIPLADLEKFIKQNKHLPDVPSATDVEREGVDLGDIQTKLLRKVEELTLYMIEQNKKIDEQKAEIDLLKTQVKLLQQ